MVERKYALTRGAFRKIVKRGQKLMVEKFGGGFFSHFMQCLQAARGC